MTLGEIVTLGLPLTIDGRIPISTRIIEAPEPLTNESHAFVEFYFAEEQGAYHRLMMRTDVRIELDG